MPFCTSCGKEVEPDQKFCEHCGALQEPAENTLTDLQPPLQTPAPLPPQTPGLKKSTGVIIGFVAVLAIIVIIYFFGLPLVQGAGHSVTTIPSHLSQTPTPVYGLTPVVTLITVTGISGSVTQDDRYAEIYEMIYTKDRSFDYGAKDVFTHDLTRPPLLIRFNLIPQIVTRQKLVDIGTSSERMVTATYPDPNAWFEVKVIDADTGAIVDSRGFNKDYSITTKQEFMVRTKGNYRIEMAGNGVLSSTQIFIGTS